MTNEQDKTILSIIYLGTHELFRFSTHNQDRIYELEASGYVTTATTTDGNVFVALTPRGLSMAKAIERDNPNKFANLWKHNTSGVRRIAILIREEDESGNLIDHRMLEIRTKNNPDFMHSVLIPGILAIGK